MIIELLIILFLFFIINSCIPDIENFPSSSNAKAKVVVPEEARLKMEEARAQQGGEEQSPTETGNTGSNEKMSKKERQKQKKLQKNLFNYIKDQEEVVSNFEQQVVDLKDSVNTTSSDLVQYEESADASQEYGIEDF